MSDLYDKLQNRPYGRNVVGHCLQTLQISRTAYEEIREAIERSGGGSRILDSMEGKTFASIDMAGIELQCLEARLAPA